MRTLRFWLGLLLLAGTLPACTPFLFEDPQPAGVKAVDQFGEDVQGAFVAEEGDTLWVRDREIILSESGENSVTRAGLADRELEIRGDQLVHIPSGRAVSFTMDGDTLYYQDTHYMVLGISDTLVVKHDRGLYFINLYTEDGWMLYLLNREDRQQVRVRSMDVSEDLEAVRERIPVEEVLDEGGNVDYYLARPSREALWGLIRDGLFREESYFHALE